MFVGLVYTVSRKLSLYHSVELEAVKTRSDIFDLASASCSAVYLSRFFSQTWVSVNFPFALTFYRAHFPLRDSVDTSFISITTAGCRRLWASVIMWLSAIINQLSPWWMLCFHSLMSEASETASLFLTRAPCFSASMAPGEVVFMGVPIGLSTWMLHLWV